MGLGLRNKQKRRDLRQLSLALFADEVDLCVHSLKDMPTVFPEGTQLGAILKRAEYKDAWVSKDGLALEDMDESHKVASVQDQTPP